MFTYILLVSFLLFFCFLFHAFRIEGSYVYLNCRVYHHSTRARAEMYLMAVRAMSNSHVRHIGRDYEDSGPVATLIL